MNTVTATEAKNRFGQVLDMAQAGPVRIQKSGRDVAVVLSAEQYATLTAQAPQPKVNPLIERLHAKSVERWGKVYEALAK